ncbi:hypothetical protein ZHAS_00003553 [Anopheles sinensis]|uniref:Uncharacterized protein n=1 Tax=Anopheles sinensis TaxID=74873 RepID=A0A084VEJ6_ANOSI|nr:hypothetical protein ZHAS_00003553 [Anopheles sinensis]
MDEKESDTFAVERQQVWTSAEHWKVGKRKVTFTFIHDEIRDTEVVCFEPLQKERLGWPKLMAL